MGKPITKAVFPVAGMGSRFLPATKASPKEMLPVVDKPLIQYAVEEAIAAGLTEMIFVTGRNKRAIEDHFDRAAELEMALQERGNVRLLETVRGILPRGVHCVFIRQPEQLGLGHAVLCARDLVGDESFVVALGDCVFGPPDRGNVTERLVELFEAHQADAVLAFERVPREKVSRYGIAAPLDAAAEPGAGAKTRLTGTAEPGAGARGRLTGEVFTLGDLVEKPSIESAPSNLAVAARYVFSPRLWPHLVQLSADNASRGVGGEIQLTDAIRALIRSGGKVLGYEVQQQRRYDVGTYETYVAAQRAFTKEEGTTNQH